MNKYEFKKLKKTVLQMQKDNKPAYLKLIDVIYKCPNDSGQLIEVAEIPSGALVKEVDCYKDELFYFFCINNEPVYTVILSVSKAKERGKLNELE